MAQLRWRSSADIEAEEENKEKDDIEKCPDDESLLENERDLVIRAFGF
ncbi:MAG: hypothetical protein LUE90_01950 [Clostridiales bacterium]|nr:hypothetical protein [Clostridiales bacterium]